MTEMHSDVADNFSLTEGGPLHRLLFRLGLAGEERQRVVVRASLMVLITWLPLLVLSLVQGVAYGTHMRIPFLRDFAVNVRFLIAIPILVLAESRIDRKWRILVVQFLRSRLVPEKELPAFESVIEKATGLRDRVLPEVLLLVASFLPSIFVRRELLISGISNWHNTGDGAGETSLAGWWFNLVSTPFFRFLLLRWMWRLFLWTSFL